MSSRASEVPKGRINVKFEVDTDGQKQEVSLPYKVMYVGDLGGDTPKAALRDREAVAVDVDNFDEVVKAHRPSLSLTVPDHVSGVPDQKFNVDLAFESLDDFTPDRLLEKVEALKALKARRDALAAIRYPLDTGRGDLGQRLADLLGDEAARRVIRAHYQPSEQPSERPSEPEGERQ